MKKLNYWLLTSEYPPHFGGGISTYCKHTVEMLKDIHNLTIFALDNTVEQEQIVTEDEAGYKVIRFNGRSSVERLGDDADLCWRLCTVVLDYLDSHVKPDVIEVQDYLGIGYFLIHKKKELDDRLRNIKIIITAHALRYIYDKIDEMPQYKFPQYWMYYFEKYCLLNADGIIYCSEYIKQCIENDLNITTPTMVISNPYETSASPVNTDYNDNEVAFIGKLSTIKGAYKLCEMLEKYYWSQNINIKLQMFGVAWWHYLKDMYPWHYISEKHSRAYKKGLLIYKGKIEQIKIAKQLDSVKVIIIPSLCENFPYVALEQMSLGKVLLVSHSGGQSEIVQEGESGFIYHSDAEFKEKLDYILSLDKSEYRRIAGNAQKRVRELCNYASVCEKKNTFIQSILKSNSQTYEFVFLNRKTKPFFPSKSKLSTTRTFVKSLLSVVVPYYNMQDYIDDAIKSILASTYQNIEIIVVNDGSNHPEAKPKLDQLQEEYPNITVLHKENGGLADARNYGFNHINGEYAAILDPDDMIMPELYEKAIKVLQAYENIHFVSCYLQNFGAVKGRFITWDIELPYYLFHNSVVTACLVYKTTALLAAGRNTSAMKFGFEDYESAINMVEHGYNCIVLTEDLFLYRIRPDSMFRQLNYYSICYLVDIIAQSHQDLFAQYASELVSLLNQNGSSLAFDNPTFQTPEVTRMEETLQLGATKKSSHGSIYCAVHHILTKTKIIIPLKALKNVVGSIANRT